MLQDFFHNFLFLFNLIFGLLSRLSLNNLLDLNLFLYGLYLNLFAFLDDLLNQRFLSLLSLLLISVDKNSKGRCWPLKELLCTGNSIV